MPPSFRLSTAGLISLCKHAACLRKHVNSLFSHRERAPQTIGRSIPKLDLIERLDELERDVKFISQEHSLLLLMEAIVFILLELIDQNDPDAKNEVLSTYRDDLERAKAGFEQWGSSYVHS